MAEGWPASVHCSLMSLCNGRQEGEEGAGGPGFREWNGARWEQGSQAQGLSSTSSGVGFE